MSKYLIDRLTKSTKFIISSGGKGTKFGMRDIPALNMKNNYHIGNDYNTPTGTKLYAPCDGTVLRTRRVGNASDYGNQIFFYMEDYGYTLHLAHLSDIGPIEDKTLKEGDYLGATGNTGKSTGPHLHLGVAKGKKLDTVKGTYGDGTWVDPSTFYIEDKPKLKSNEEIAKEVRLGKWGNGQERKDRLIKAGYNYNAVQDIVNAAAPAPVVPKPEPKPEPTPAPKPTTKVKVGDKVTYSGYLYKDSAGKGRGVKVSGTYTVTIVNNNAYGVHLDQIGWVKPSDVSKVGASTTPKPKPQPVKNEYGQNVKVGDTIDFSMLYTSVNGGTKFVATNTGSNQKISRRYIATRKVNGKNVQVYRAKVGKIYPKSSGHPNAYEVLTDNGAILGRVNPINVY